MPDTIDPHDLNLQIDEQALIKKDWAIIFLISTAHAASHFFQLVIPSLALFLKQDFGFDFSQLGFLVSAFYLTSSIGQASSGFIVDKIGARPMLWFGLSAFIVSGIILGLAQNYSMLLLAAIVGGIGNAVFHPVDYSLLNLCVSQKRLGHGFSMHGLTGNLGWALTPIFIPSIAWLTNWRIAAFSASILVGLVLWITFLGRNFLLTPKQSKPHTNHNKQDKHNAFSSLQALLTRPTLWGAFLFFAFSSIALSAVQNYTIPLLGSLYSLSVAYAGSALTGYMAASALGIFLGGFLVSANPRTEITVTLALIFSGLLLICVVMKWVPTLFVIPLVILAGFCSGIAAPSRDMLIRRVAPKGSTGSVYGLVYSGMDVGSALGPSLFGLFLDLGYVRAPWIGAGIAFCMAAFMAQWIAWNMSKSNTSN